MLFNTNPPPNTYLPLGYISRLYDQGLIFTHWFPLKAGDFFPGAFRTAGGEGRRKPEDAGDVSWKQIVSGVLHVENWCLRL